MKFEQVLKAVEREEEFLPENLMCYLEENYKILHEASEEILPSAISVEESPKSDFMTYNKRSAFQNVSLCCVLFSMFFLYLKCGKM